MRCGYIIAQARCVLYYLRDQPFQPLDPSAVRSRHRLGLHQPDRRKKSVVMLYESTKSLLQTILRSLETGDDTGWDDQTESGNSCLYEMHQMSGSLYKPYRPDRLNPHSLAQSTLPDKLTRAIPHVRTMVIAIRHKDQTRALESGKAALAEMNGTSRSIPSGSRTAATTESKGSAVVRQHEKPSGKRRLLVEGRQILVSS
jgi:hypothetical protein